MIPQNQVEWRLESPETGEYAVITSVIMIYHIAKMEHCIQRQGIEYFYAAVKFSKRKPVLPYAIWITITILAIGENADSDYSGILRNGGSDVKYQENCECKLSAS